MRTAWIVPAKLADYGTKNKTKERIKMKNFKKLTALLLALVMMFALSVCAIA